MDTFSATDFLTFSQGPPQMVIASLKGEVLNCGTENPEVRIIFEWGSKESAHKDFSMAAPTENISLQDGVIELKAKVTWVNPSTFVEQKHLQLSFSGVIVQPGTAQVGFTDMVLSALLEEPHRRLCAVADVLAAEPAVPS